MPVNSTELVVTFERVQDALREVYGFLDKRGEPMLSRCMLLLRTCINQDEATFAALAKVHRITSFDALLAEAPPTVALTEDERTSMRHIFETVMLWVNVQA